MRNFARKKNHYANRGMGLEEDLEQTNQYYLEHDIAVIYKKPTAVTIKNVTYPEKKYTKITDGYFTKSSTTDYNGIYRGWYIDFEAKETKNKTSFALSMLQNHQLQHLQNIKKHNGIAFLIIRFTFWDRTFLLDIEKLNTFTKNNKRKSIPFSFFEEEAWEIKNGYQPRLDYLKIIEQHYL